MLDEHFQYLCAAEKKGNAMDYSHVVEIGVCNIVVGLRSFALLTVAEVVS